MARTANAKEGDLIAFGHTHKPWHHEVAGIHILNTGSVGKPKDGVWRVGYGLVEAREEVQVVEFVRVEYDVERRRRASCKAPCPTSSRTSSGPGKPPSCGGHVANRNGR